MGNEDFDDDLDDVDDEIGEWSVVKLDILREYVVPYTRILKSSGLTYLYVDAFASSGWHYTRPDRVLVEGSPLIALNADPPFHEYHFIDLNRDKVAALQQRTRGRENVFIYQGDANSILRKDVLPRARYKDFRRALCLLDPYGMDYEWNLVEEIGKMRSVEIFLHFPIMGINRNVLRHDRATVNPMTAARMTRLWGDDSWSTTSYKVASDAQMDMFGALHRRESKTATNQDIVSAYRDRLRAVAGFKFVPEPIAMRNSIGQDIYYLFFASHNDTGRRIVEHIFGKRRRQGG